MFGALFLLFLFRAVSTQMLSNIVDEECLNYTVYPLQYDVTIKPKFFNDQFYYDCDISITVIANAPTNVIEMEAKHMNIQGESLRVFKGSQDIIDRPRPYEYDPDRGKLRINLKEYLIPYKGQNTQKYDIKMRFRKKVTEESYGVFVVKYLDEHRQIRYFIQTRPSPDYAKYFIPCFDNPRFDSMFKFAVHIPPDNRIYYNTSLVVAEQFKQDTLPDGTLVIYYVPSPQIYLYQVGFHYSQFSNVRIISRSTNDTIVVWAPGHLVKNCYYTLNFGNSVLLLMRRYTQLDRSLTTEPINIVAVPKDLNGYEIGSWNLLTNNEIRVINNPHYMSIKQLETMHFELTQQLCRIWLGNPREPVAKTKWREEWFKEGMATYFAYYFLSQFTVGHRIDDKYPLPLKYYGLKMRHKAMQNDWLSVPALINFDNELAVNIPSRYKQLVTMKTASLLWMIENYVGSERFHAALVKYINNRRGMSISLQDFKVNLDRDTVDCFSGHNESRASAVLDSWFKHPGYPVLHVRVLRNRSPNVIQLKQRRFTFSGHSKDSNFLIPISYVIQNTSNCFTCHQAWFATDRQSYTFEENLNGGWIIFNRNASGYYRVNYDDHTWMMIAKSLRNDIFSIDEMNRAQIANDVFALFTSGDLNQDLAMNILDFLDKERSFIVWDAVASGYEMLKIDNANCGMTKHIYNDWQVFLRKKIEDMFSHVMLVTNTEHEKHTRLFRASIVELACAVGNKQCLDQADHLYTQWTMMNERIDPDIRQTCFRVAYKTRQDIREGYIFNSYEMSDKKAALAAVQRENHFMYKTPMGEPRPENMTRTTEDPDLQVSTAKSVQTGFGVKNIAASQILVLNIFIIVMASFIII